MALGLSGEGDGTGLVHDAVARWVSEQLADCPVMTMSISSLVGGETPRSVGTNIEHARVLAGVSEKLPPIVVHRVSSRVIDGAHRVRAAELRGEHLIGPTECLPELPGSHLV
jgi:hypothetical protein